MRRGYTTRDLGISKSATRLDELANPDHEFVDGRVTARKAQKPSSKSERIGQIGGRFSPGPRIRKIGNRRLRPRVSD
jgi:hypothetical protein